jgi:tetratricopeptide (TPR) repeat protein
MVDVGIVIRQRRVNTLNTKIIEKNCIIMKINNWEPIDPAFIKSLSTDQLNGIWSQLHAADLAPLPEGDLLEAWLLFHNGHYAEAAESALALGDVGIPVVMRAVVAYTDYVCEDEDECVGLLEKAYQLGENSGSDDVNTQFTTALAMGRYSQSISITKALTKGLGGKVKQLLSNVLSAEPTHAEAHLAMAMYHAEIIDKVGATLGGLTYGANANKAIEHIEKALELVPNAINLIEAGNAWLLLKGEKKGMDQATDYYQQAAEVEPLDALQSMDVDFAQSQLED